MFSLILKQRDFDLMYASIIHSTWTSRANPEVERRIRKKPNIAFFHFFYLNLHFVKDAVINRSDLIAT